MEPNVLLVILDSVRARNLSLYHHNNETTPFLDEFSTESTVYTQARSPGTWSLPSHVSIFTGLHVAEHRITFRNHRLKQGTTIWDRLTDEHGYTTGVFSANPYLTEVPVGLKRPFNTIVGRMDLPFPDAADPREFVRQRGRGQFLDYLMHCATTERPIASLLNGIYEKFERDVPSLVPERVRSRSAGQLFVDRFLDWERRQTGPWGACINLMDAHHPYEPNPEHDLWGGDLIREIQGDIESLMWEFNCGHRPWWQRKALESLYDGAIHQMDAQLDKLVTELDRRGVLDETLLVVTSDHGEAFGEPSTIRHGARSVGHGNGGIHEVLLHVPLIVSYPGQDSSTTIPDICSLRRFPNVVDDVVAGDWKVGNEFVDEGQVLASTDGLNDRMRRNAKRYCDDLYLFDGQSRAVYTTQNGQVRKYVTWRSESATVEVRDAQTAYKTPINNPELVENAFNGIEDAGVGEEQTVEVDSSVQRRLEELGYA